MRRAAHPIYGSMNKQILIRGRAGTAFGGWRLESLLGEGAFGATWRARGVGGRSGAIKLLSEPPGAELLALRSVCHPAIPALLDAGSEPSPFLVMELAPGQPLDERLDNKALPVDLAIRIAIHLMDGLAALHHANIRHGDIKPANLVVTTTGALKIVDFGMTEGCGGTLAYAAPEAGEGAAAPSDVYSAGLVLWEMLHGALPFASLSTAEALMRRRSDLPRAERGPSWLADLLARMLEPQAELRCTASNALEVLYCRPRSAVPMTRKGPLPHSGGGPLVSSPKTGAQLTAGRLDGRRSSHHVLQRKRSACRRGWVRRGWGPG